MDESTVLSKFDSLVEAGLVQYDDKQKIVEYTEGGLKFHFLVTSALTKKPTIHTSRPQAEREGSDISTSGYEINDDDLSRSNSSSSGGHSGGATHVLIANKFSFARPHLMLLTSDGYRRQYEPLDENDLRAVWTTLGALSGSSSSTGRDYMAFYNCGRDGGCSRLHKHMQLIPTPEDSFASFLDTSPSSPSGGGSGGGTDGGLKTGSEPTNVPYQWFYHRFGSSLPHPHPHPQRSRGGTDITPADLVQIYTALLERATTDAVAKGFVPRPGGAGEAAAAAAAAAATPAYPHNLILTTRWMIVIPRRQGAINKEAGANALGMLGIIAVATDTERENWVRLGLVESLRELGVPN